MTLGIAALVRKLRRRAEVSSAPTEPEMPAASDHADELRRKLAESRADVHAEGRATLDEMRSSSDD